MYECADGLWLFLAAVSDDERGLLARAVGGLGGDVADAEAAALLAARFSEKPAAEWFATLDQAAVPVEIVNEEFCRTIFDDPEARRLQLVSATWSGGVGKFEDPGLLVNLSPADGVIQRGPCLCGEHSREILVEHGFSDAEVDVLAKEGAILDAPVETPPPASGE
jgi:crotonobetainyl-CoA:carnitine CoA-transferase CaiB-like acyl-CoA transferase